MSFAGNSRRRWWLGLVALAVVVGLAYWRVSKVGNVASGAQSTAHMPMAHVAIPVTAARSQLGDLNRYITAIGSVAAFNTVTVRTQVNGQLVKIAFKEGQMVHKGELLAIVDPRPYKVQLLQAQGQLARDRATLSNAQITLKRDRTLFAENVIARQDLDNQAALVGQSQGTIIADQAAIDSAKLQLTYCHITAPLTGRIGLRLVDQGNYVQASNATGIAVITQLQPIAVDFSVPEDDLPQIQSDMREGRQLPVDAYDRAFKRQLASGFLLTMSNEINQTTGTIELKAEFPNKNSALFPNQFVNARLLVGTDHNVVLVPSAAIQRSSQTNTFVYVVESDHTVEARDVRTGASEGGLVEITSGLAPGEVVVTNGTDKLQQGSRVTVQMAENSVPADSNSGGSGTDSRTATGGSGSQAYGPAATSPGPNSAPASRSASGGR
ncbi:MAG: MdtA/MuxA family multidrug efflux RND transporter periplasmic adaptor subunit [Candidatus Binataceae bacterium]